MGNRLVNLDEWCIYFDGRLIHFGKLERIDEDLWLFVTLDQTCGVYLVKDEINADFRKNKKAVMVLKDAIIGNAYGEDRNRGKENAGLDEKENEYINRLYRVTEFDMGELKMHECILRDRIGARMLQADYEERFLESQEQLNATNNPTSVDLKWHEIVSEGLDKARGTYAITNKNFNKSLEELINNMTESEAQ